MSDIVFSKYHDTEIAKADDFRFTASAPVDIITAIFDGAFDDVINSFVVSGMEIAQLASPTMNVQIAPGMAFSRAENKLLHLYSAVSALVSPAHETLDRLDTVEARYLSTNFNQETRAFKSPETGAITYNLVNTKTKVFVELKCVEGVAGSGVAPDVETGWMKLAEVEVLAGTTQIINANIHNIDAEEDGTTNSAWTAEVDASFHLGSIEEIKNTLYAHVRNNITSVNTVHGIRQGAGNGLDSDLLDGEHGSFYRNTANLDSGEYKITRSLIPGTDQYQLNILRADYDQAVVKIGPKSDWPDEDLLSYPKEATLTLYASRARWYDLYVDLSLNRLADPDFPKFVTFMRGDGIRVPEWMVQYRKDSGAYTTLLSCDPEIDGRFYARQGSLVCKLTEIGALGLSARDESGPYYVDSAVEGLPVAESGVIYHAQSPYSTESAAEDYQSFIDPTNRFTRIMVAGTWSAWKKSVINRAIKGTLSISDLGSENSGLTKPLTLSANGTGIGYIGVDGDADVLELSAGSLKINGAISSVGSTALVTNLNADLLDSRHTGNADGNIPISNGTLNTNLNADLLDGQHGSYYRDADTLDGQHGSYYRDADTLDGYHASAFAFASWFSGGLAGYYDYYVIPASSAWVIPAGFYMFSDGNSYHRLEIYSPTLGWKGSNGNIPTGLILSDGVNFRIYNTLTSNNSIGYRKLL